MNKFFLKKLSVISLLTTSITFSLAGCGIFSDDEIDTKIDNELNESNKTTEKNIKISVDNNDFKGSILNEYNEKWNIYYTGDYKNLILNDGEGSFYSSITDDNIINGISKGITKQELLDKKDKSKIVDYIEKPSGLYDIKSDEYLVYKENNMYVFYFFDLINSNKLRSVLAIPIDIENQKEGFFGKSSTEFKYSMEDLMVDLINAERIEKGLNKLTYDKKLNEVARLHSQDMIDNKFFDHVNLKGETVKDRMEEAGYDERIYAENIAYGQFSSIFAHEALMNSEGHRENILNPDYTHVGVGVELGEDNIPYYTINFYTEK